MSADKYVWLAKLGVSQQAIKQSVSQRVAGRGADAKSIAGGGANAKVAEGGANAKGETTPVGDKLPQPMPEDCKVVQGKVPGPDHHVFCGKHGHVLDIKARTVIAIDLADYAKRYPPKKKDGPGANVKAVDADKAKSGKDGKAAVPGTDAKAAPTAPQKQAAPAPDPTAPAKPAPAGPDADIAKKTAEAKKIMYEIQIWIENFAFTLKTYEDFTGGGAINRAVSWTSDQFGGAQDPGGVLTQIQREIGGEQALGIAAVSSQNFDQARKHATAIKEKAERAQKIFESYRGNTMKGAERTVKVLEVADKVGDLAQAGLGKGGQALGMVKKTAVVAMKVHLDQKVDWIEFGVDMAFDLFFAKLGGDQLTKRVTGPVIAKLAGKFGSKVSKEVIEKTVENVVKSEFKTVVKTTAQVVHKAANGKPMTYDEILTMMVEKLLDPKELLMTMASSKVEAAKKK